MLQRNANNPILKPDPQNVWENQAVFNGSIAKRNNQYILLYRAMGEEKAISDKKISLSVIGKAISEDGVNFYGHEPFIRPEYDWEKFGCEDPRVTQVEDKYLIFYTALANYPPNYRGIRCALAISPDLNSVEKKYLITPFNAKAMTIFPQKINGLYSVLVTVNTDNPPTYIGLAQVEKVETLWDMFFWRQWYDNLDKHIINLQRTSSDQVEVGAPPILTRYGWLLLYSYIKHYYTDNLEKEFRIEGVLLHPHNPQRIVGRIEKPLLVPEREYELYGKVPNIVFPSGALIEDNKLKVYYGASDTYCALAEASWSELLDQFEVSAPYTVKCQKFPNNPLLEPVVDHQWESKGVFNPAAIELNGKIYLIYRALSEDNISNLGLAVSNDGLFIDERLAEPIYPLRTVYEKPLKTGLGGGVEDPRITRIGNILYMCYTAYDGNLPRLAITSISIDSFLARKWNQWKKPKIISQPGVMDKDGALFPEKINGKYVIFHRIEPNMVIDYLEDLDFEKKYFLDSHEIVNPRNRFWDSLKIGLNGPPIKTTQGWLVLYHGISEIDHYYRLGALILDVDDVTRVIARTAYPILEPETYFEKVGIVNNVVFSCGQVIKDGEIYIYYGGADKVVCGAKINIEKLIDYVIKSSHKKYLIHLQGNPQKKTSI